jgi:predicted GH43/DUF377 family glycosyl hydrolase
LFGLFVAGVVIGAQPEFVPPGTGDAAGLGLLQPDTFRPYIDASNQNDNELYAQQIPNSAAWDFLKTNIPWFECPDKEIEQIYYFRWWTYRKHIKQTPDGFIITEFLPPVPWAGKYNSISCAAGHHFYEGRWLHDPKYLDAYSRFWFHGGDPRRYSFWAANALWARYLVTGDPGILRALLPDLVENYHAWEKARRDPNGLFWQEDGQDGMEVSIGGSGYRATINSYMYGDACALADIAALDGEPALVEEFRADAARLKRLVEEKLWDAQAQFYKVAPRSAQPTSEAEPLRLVNVREEHGFTPWYFDLPGSDKSAAWRQLMQPQGFYAPFGPTTAEQRHPKFAVAYQGHECQWNGPSWPYSTSITLTALANLLNHYQQNAVSRDDYFALLKMYAHSHRLKLDDGRVVPWIDENLNPATGDWIARTLLKQRGSAIPERGKDYNHSTFCDLVITGLIGLRPRADELVELNPLAPESWDYFCLDRILYHGRWLTILWDKSGERYHKGKGLRLFVDGREIRASLTLTRLQAALSPTQTTAPLATSGGWQKYEGNPILGGKYGTCFDVSVLKEGSAYRMWLSWRPKRSVALVESPDGIHWSEPPQIVLGPRPETGWENDINRPVVLKRADGYHMWYTGQARGHSSIGYATSPDGTNWTRQSPKPVLTADVPWEKGAAMCPHALWDATARLFRMWYSAGEQYEPDAVGYATSPDGLNWTKHPDNPVFKPDPTAIWEQAKVTGVQVERHGDWYLMFYIGFRDTDHAQIGVARSRDGIGAWQRHPANPIIRPGKDQWDHDACYKPYAIFDGQKWLLWYNGRHGSLEQIGLALHPGEDLGF